MGKNTFPQHKLLTKNAIGLFCVLLALAGFLFSRAMLSIGIILFGINALRDVHPKRWLHNKWWLLGVAWVGLYALSWFWTQDKPNWSERFDVKLPILLLPLAFGFMPAYTRRQMQLFTLVAGLLLLCSVFYSLYVFAGAPVDYISGYNVSHVLPTLPEDHIRVSICMAMFVVWCTFVWPWLSGGAKAFTGFVVFAIVIFLHLLAARTGLLVLYLFVLLYALYIALRKSKVTGLGILALLITVLVVGYHTSPTLRNRMAYVQYTYGLFREGGLQGHYSDMGRLISYDIALKKIVANPWVGVGAGDILSEMKNGYAEYYPDVDEAHMLVPHNQFLMVAMGCGIPALFIFLVWLLWPLRGMKRRHRGSFFFLATWLVLLVPLFVEPTLEVQYGVYVYLFFLLWQRHAMLHEPAANE